MMPAAEKGVEVEQECAVCGMHVDELNARMSYRYQRPDGTIRIGYIHAPCVPTEGIEMWMAEQIKVGA